MCFEEPSRIGIKILFIKIAGVFDRGEITSAILAVRITKRHDVGLQLNYTHNGEILCGAKLFIINRKKGPDFTKVLIRNISSVNRFLINTEKLVVPVK